jgi:putative peptidoglycan lipid II flippase
LLRSVPRMVIAGLAMVVALLVLNRMVFVPVEGGGLLRWVGLGVMVGGGMLAYGLAGQVIGAFNLRELAGGRRRAKA